MATTTVNNYIENVRTYFSNFQFSSLGIPGLALLILAMLVIPLPPLLLDILLLLANIAISRKIQSSIHTHQLATTVQLVKTV